VADDPCRRLPVAAAPGRFHRVGPRPPSRCRRTEAPSVPRAPGSRVPRAPGSLPPLSSRLLRLETAVRSARGASV
jgi:hypothetical protein